MLLSASRGSPAHVLTSILHLLPWIFIGTFFMWGLNAVKAASAATGHHRSLAAFAAATSRSGRTSAASIHHHAMPPASSVAFFQPSLSQLHSQQSPARPASSATALFSSFSVSQDAYPRDVIDEELLESGYRRPPVQWYPGHIAKAERQLSETLRAVDVVVEVRDARACKATSHPRVGEWCAGRPRIVVMTHVDTIPKSAEIAWKRAYENLGAHRWDDTPINPQVPNQAKQAKNFRTMYVDDNNNSAKASSNGKQVISPVEQVLFVDAKQGQGIHALHRAIMKAGQHVNERRNRRGLNSRPLRVGIIGYPNVGKSALINRILGRKRARTANTPGVTRSLQWIRVRSDDKAKASGSTRTEHFRKEFELLDSPGIIPAKMVDQSDAVLLAACNCIGNAAYDNQAVAAYLCEWLKTIYIMEKQGQTAPAWRDRVKERYCFDPLEKIQDYVNPDQLRYMSGEDMLFKVADNTCQGNPEDAARKILQDFRTGRMGPTCLQLAPQTETDRGHVNIPISAMDGRDDGDPTKAISMIEFRKQQKELQLQEQQNRARAAKETAKERGLELPPIIAAADDDHDGGEDDAESSSSMKETDVGKGMFDGW